MTERTLAGIGLVVLVLVAHEAEHAPLGLDEVGRVHPAHPLLVLEDHEALVDVGC